MLHLLHTATEDWINTKLLSPICIQFQFPLRHSWINETNKNMWPYLPRSIRANVFSVHPCTLSNGTRVAFTAASALLLLENKSKSKQLPLVQGGNTIRFSHPWKAFCLWVQMHGRMHFNHSRVQYHPGEREWGRKMKTILHNAARLSATVAFTSRVTYCIWKQCSV